MTSPVSNSKRRRVAWIVIGTILLVVTVTLIGNRDGIWKAYLKYSGKLEQFHEVAVSDIKSVFVSQVLFQEMDKNENGIRDYASSLKELYETGMLDSPLSSGRKGGYVFEIIPTPGADAGFKETWSLIAKPINPGFTGVKFFYVEDGGIMNVSLQDPISSIAEKMNDSESQVRLIAAMALREIGLVAPEIESKINLVFERARSDWIVDDDMFGRRGLQVTNAASGGVFERAGINQDDFIFEVDGKSISESEIQDILDVLEGKRTAVLKVDRGLKEKGFSASEVLQVVSVILQGKHIDIKADERFDDFDSIVIRPASDQK